MTKQCFQLHSAPIVEAVVEIDCDMPPAFELAGLESRAREVFREQYPKFRTQFIEEHEIKQHGGEPAKYSARRAVQAFQCLQEDERQLVQVRMNGFAFNRLAPYGGLDDYMDEIKRTWLQFIALTSPIQIRAVRLRYINRILLPMKSEALQLQDFLKVSPQLPNESNLTFVGFLNQHSAIESGTGNQANIVLTTQPPEADNLPIILDIGVHHVGPSEPDDWVWIAQNIQSLRSLKNRIFKNTLTERCLNLFQHSA
jgi:uncharacterized protein (TIGR04255 family)